ncbi:FkbM family methyltransferase [Halorubraceae archaeon YAN]|nr:FkbM family methyltransferase [Halorubraceae archaeon YAN]
MFRRLYSDHIRTISKRYHIHPFISRGYKAYETTRYAVVSKLGENTFPVSVSGIDAQFTVTTQSEYNRLRRINENDDLMLLLAELRADDTLWDFGANIGTHTILAGKLLQNGHVLAVEPYSRNARKLRQNIVRNRLDNVSVEEAALGDQNGEIELRIEDGGETGTVGHTIVPKSDAGLITVPMKTGDSFLSRYPHPDVVKIDVQAAELQVLRGMTKVLNSDCRTVFCETHPRMGVDTNEVCAFFEKFDFRPQVVNEDEITAQVIAQKESTTS